MAITPLASQPNCNLSFCSHYGGLPVLRLAVEAVEALVLEVLDVHGLLDNPGHWVLVLGQHSDPELVRDIAQCAMASQWQCFNGFMWSKIYLIHSLGLV